MVQFKEGETKSTKRVEIRGTPDVLQVLSRPSSSSESVTGDDRVVCVSGSSSRTVPPDECSCKFMLCTSKPKETAAEARQSVLRREDYVKQILRSHGCHVSFVLSANISSVSLHKSRPFAFLVKNSCWIKDFNEML